MLVSSSHSVVLSFPTAKVIAFITFLIAMANTGGKAADRKRALLWLTAQGALCGGGNVAGSLVEGGGCARDKCWSPGPCLLLIQCKTPDHRLMPPTFIMARPASINLI